MYSHYIIYAYQYCQHRKVKTTLELNCYNLHEICSKTQWFILVPNSFILASDTAALLNKPSVKTSKATFSLLNLSVQKSKEKETSQRS